jgi:hypothetical protein
MRSTIRPVTVDEARTASSRVMTKARWDADCLLWQGAKYDNGAGQIRVGSRTDRTMRNAQATHVMLALDGRPVGAGMVARHTCGRADCVNPEHLEVREP